MTYDDSIRVIERLKGGWSKHLSDDTFGIWLDELEPLEFSPAYAAARTLIRTSKYFPAISEFLDAYATHERDQRPYVPTVVCDECTDGFRLVGANTVEPCAKCAPELYEAWSHGKVPKTKDPATAVLFTPKTAAEIVARRVPEPEWAHEARRRLTAMHAALKATEVDMESTP